MNSRMPFKCKQAVGIVKASLVPSSQKAWQCGSQNTSIQGFRRIYSQVLLRGLRNGKHYCLKFSMNSKSTVLTQELSGSANSPTAREPLASTARFIAAAGSLWGEC